MKVRLVEVERYERPMTLRLPFRFGVITVTEGVQAIIRVRISLPDGRSCQGVAAESLAAKWFEKSPEFTDEQNLDQLRQSLDIAIGHYKAFGAATPFGLFVGMRTFTIAPESAARCRFAMREEFTGLLAPLITKSIPDLQPAFDEFVRCLKATAERW